VREEAVRFPNARGRQLAAILRRPEAGAPQAFVVLCHGMLSGKNSPKQMRLTELLSSHGFATLRFDFTSRYDSEGPVEEMTYTNQVGDLAAAVAWGRKTLGPLPLGLYGSSMGGAVAILYSAALEQPDALAAISAVGRPGDLWSAWARGEQLDRWRSEGWITLEGNRLPFGFYQDALNQDVPGAAAQIKAPLLLIHGARDSIVPAAQCRELHAAAAGPKRMVILPSADHRFSRPEDLETMLQEVSRWFLTYLMPRGKTSP
jgi:fermentation-respiration switch protein FrsA (DUF1100 family)